MAALGRKPQQGQTFKEALASHLSELFAKVSVEYDRSTVGLNLVEHEQRVASDTGGSEQLGPATPSSTSAMALYSSRDSPQGSLFHHLRKKVPDGFEAESVKSEPEEESSIGAKSDTSPLAWAAPKAPPSLAAHSVAPPISQPPTVVDIVSPTPESKKQKLQAKKVTIMDFEDEDDDNKDAPKPKTPPIEDDGDEGPSFGRQMSSESAGSQVIAISSACDSNAAEYTIMPSSTTRETLRIPGMGSKLPFRESVESSESEPKTPIRTSNRSCLKNDPQYFDNRLSTQSTKSASHHFDVLRHWKTDDETFRRRRTPPVKMGTGALAAFTAEEEDEYDEWEMMNEGAPQNKVLRCLMIHPSSKKQSTWQLLALIFVSYDIVTIPLEFFNPPQTSLILVMGWLVRLFWTADLGVGFLTGYVHSSGDVEMRLRHIAKKYIRTWFFLDFIIVFFNWMEVSIEHLGNAFGSAPRGLKFLKIARLLRLIKASTLSRVIGEKFRSEKIRLGFGILKILVLVLMVAHFIACLWYGVGNNGDDCWVAFYNLDDASLNSRYLWSFHWSVTQFTGPDMELQPVNDGERSFTIIVLVLCYMVSACFVSSITTSMTRLELLAEQETHLFVALRRYLDENSISTKLSSRIQRNATHTMLEKSRNVQEKEVELLTYVSEPLRIELHFEIYEPVVGVHPLFSRYMEVSPAGIRKLCHTAISVMSLSCGDVLFSDFEFPEDPRMYFLLPPGRLQYIRDGLRTQYLLEREWCCEATLWTMWMHVGMMRAMTNVRLVTIGRQSVATAMSQFRTRDFRPEMYAKSFVAGLNRGASHLTDLRDLDMDWDAMLLQAFPKDDERRTTNGASHGHKRRKSRGGGGAGNHMMSIVPSKMHEAWQTAEEWFTQQDSDG